jgi:hypothetical protein
MVSNPIDPIKRNIEEVIENEGLEFHRLYDNAGVLTDKESHLIRYQLFAKSKGNAILITNIIPVVGDRKMELETKLRQIRYLM